MWILSQRNPAQPSPAQHMAWLCPARPTSIYAVDTWVNLTFVIDRWVTLLNCSLSAALALCVGYVVITRPCTSPRSSSWRSRRPVWVHRSKTGGTARSTRRSRLYRLMRDHEASASTATVTDDQQGTCRQRRETYTDTDTGTGRDTQHCQWHGCQRSQDGNQQLQ